MRMIRLLVSVVLLGAVVCAVGCDSGRQGVSTYRVEEIDEDIQFSAGQQASLLTAARKGLGGQSFSISDAGLAGVGGGGAVVEVFLSPNKPVVHVVEGDSFLKAFQKAVEATASDPDFISKMKGDLAKTRIKVGVINMVRELSINPSLENEKVFRKLDKATDSGIHGFILVMNGKATYQIPEQLFYSGWGMDIRKRGERQKRVYGKKMIKKQLRSLSRRAADNTTAWRNGQLYAFTTYTFIDRHGKPGTPISTYRAKNMIPRLDDDSLKAAAVANADYLARIVDDQGKFTYIYYPNEDEKDSGYGFVRHAGSVFGLFEAYNHLGDEKYLEAGRRALSYLLKLVEIPEEAPHIAIIRERNRSVLGINALALMAYAVLPDDLMSDEDREYRDKLGESILYYRMPQKGYFYTSFRQALEKKAPKEQSRYYPGEAMLALVRLYEKTGDKKWWKAAQEISPGQKKRWQAAGHKQVGNYCWVGQAWARMGRIEKDPKKRDEYKKLAYSHADAVIKHQYVPGHRRGFAPDYLGGADNSRPPRTTPTSARGESLAENYLLAKFLGDVEAQKKYGVALLRAIHFFVQNQFTWENSWYLPYPEKAIGGIRGSLIANDIRIDYNQHALITELNALHVAGDLKELGVTEW